MYNITYISEADRKRLIMLQDQLRMCETVEEQQEKREEIEAIEAKRKPLSECDVTECTELRTAVWDKFDKLNRSGRYNHAQNFKMMLQQIERHQRQLYSQFAEDEAKRKRTEQEAKANQLVDAAKRKEANGEQEGDDNSKAQSVSSRWTTGIGNLD